MATYYERKWYWRRHGVTRHVWVWLYRRGSVLGSLRWYLFGTSPFRSSPVSIRYRDLAGWQMRCYCHEGRTAELHIDFFGLSLAIQFSRWWVKSPCSCDKITWLIFPDSYHDEVEEYGLERLQAEHPGINPVEARA